jgi:hypothetical protein
MAGTIQTTHSILWYLFLYHSPITFKHVTNFCAAGSSLGASPDPSELPIPSFYQSELKIHKEPLDVDTPSSLALRQRIIRRPTADEQRQQAQTVYEAKCEKDRIRGYYREYADILAGIISDGEKEIDKMKQQEQEQ